MTVIGMLHSQKDPSIVKKAFACAAVAKMEDVEFYYFTYGSVDVVHEKIDGWIYEKGKWIPQKKEFPDVIINISSPKNEKQALISEKLKKKCLFTSSSVGNKMKVYKKILKGKQFSDFVIPFFYIKKGKEVPLFFKTYHRIVIKPITGSQGRDILFIEKLPSDSFLVINGSKSVVYTKEDFILYIEELIAGKKYLVQPFIESKTKAGLTYDLRLHVQKNGLGEWDITLIYPRISGSKMASNVSSGGYRGELIPFLEEEFGEHYFNIKRLLEHFALSFSNHFESLYDNDFDELGIDIGIDENQKLWIYEVNWRPGSKHREFEVAKKLIPYAVFLANKNN
ncbi:MAG: YheC/YheD family protein [Bacillota bacterium]